MSELIATVDGRPVTASCGMTLSEIACGEKPCGGHGRCGKCRVRASGALSLPCEAEKKHLSAEELASGVRLACLTYALGDCVIETSGVSEEETVVVGGRFSATSLVPAFVGCGVAIDLGTTTLAAVLYDSKGRRLSEAARLNPQQRWGADVISRIEAALHGEAAALAATIREVLDAMIVELATAGDVGSESIETVVITGNTVMLSLLVGEDVEPFSHAPFAARRLFGERLTAEAVGLRALRAEAEVYLPPCISAFVGADTVCAILATGLCEHHSAMLVDIGTNGEIALFHDGALTACSTAAGPAFEGVGISMGMRGARGAIDRVSLADGVTVCHVIGDGEPIGICGSGLIDAVACMLAKETLDESGCLEEERFVLREPVCLIPKDIRMLQLGKSAICAGILTLIRRAGCAPASLERLFVAGGFGRYLDQENAARIGLLPRALVAVTETVGNAALDGAVLLLLTAESRRRAEALAAGATTLDLSTDAAFSEAYMAGMLLREM